MHGSPDKDCKQVFTASVTWSTGEQLVTEIHPPPPRHVFIINTGIKTNLNIFLILLVVSTHTASKLNTVWDNIHCPATSDSFNGSFLTKHDGQSTPPGVLLPETSTLRSTRCHSLDTACQALTWVLLWALQAYAWMTEPEQDRKCAVSSSCAWKHNGCTHVRYIPTNVQVVVASWNCLT